MFIAMNNFKVNPEKGEDFETVWRTRESHLQGVAGFVQFALLKGDDPGDYVSHSTWESREAFMNWAKSEGFRQAHGGGLASGVMAGHPVAKFYEAVLVEPGVTPTAETAPA